MNNQEFVEWASAIREGREKEVRKMLKLTINERHKIILDSVATILMSAKESQERRPWDGPQPTEEHMRKLVGVGMMNDPWFRRTVETLTHYFGDILET